MSFDQLNLNKERYWIKMNQQEDTYYYLFDYDKREYSVNMNFQHFHPFYEVFVLADDSAAHIIEGRYFDLQMLDIVCLRPGVLHKTFYPEGQPKKRVIIQFSFVLDIPQLDEEYRQMLSIFDEQVPIFRFPVPVQDCLIGILTRIFCHGANETELMHLVLHYQLMDFLCTIYQNRNSNLYRNKSQENAMTEKIYNICAYIHSHYSETLTLEMLAKQNYVSAWHLSKQFSLITGFNLTEYIQRTRIRNAQQSLIFTDKKITDIANRCGFHSFSQFNRVFRKICEASPSEYRRNNRKYLNY